MEEKARNKLEKEIRTRQELAAVLHLAETGRCQPSEAQLSDHLHLKCARKTNAFPAGGGLRQKHTLCTYVHAHAHTHTHIQIHTYTHLNAEKERDGQGERQIEQVQTRSRGRKERQNIFNCRFDSARETRVAETV